MVLSFGANHRNRGRAGERRGVGFGRRVACGGRVGAVEGVQDGGGRVGIGEGDELVALAAAADVTAY